MYIFSDLKQQQQQKLQREIVSHYINIDFKTKTKLINFNH